MKDNVTSSPILALFGAIALLEATVRVLSDGTTESNTTLLPVVMAVTFDAVLPARSLIAEIERETFPCVSEDCIVREAV